MKPVLSLIGGLLTSLGMFVSGVAVATYFLYTEPAPRAAPSVDVSDLWTGEPRTVNTSVQPFERLPALQPEPYPEPLADTAEVMNANLGAAPVDPIATNSLQTAPEEGAAGEEGGLSSAAHAQWCADRYRSWRPADNNYTSFSGEQRPCVSPYSREMAAAVEPSSPALPEEESYAEFVGEEPLLQYASDDGAASADSDHVSYCFNRYRSYRPEDNSYQPFGGGPRQQCR
jgi:hypothetical protein